MNTGEGKLINKVFFLLPAVAAAVLAVSHALDLRMGHPMYDLADPVFPFMTGGMLYFTFTLFLLAYTVLCFSAGFFTSFAARYSVAAAIALLFSILWYRASLAILGIAECRCLGILGSAFSLTKSQEQLFRVLLLVALCLPSLLVLSAPLAAIRRKRLRAVLQLSLVILPALAARGASTIHLTGGYSLRAQNPLSAAAYADLSSTGTFAVHLSGTHYKICLTNSGNGWITGAWFDGESLHYYDIPNTNRGSGMIFVDKGNWLLAGPRNNIPSYLFWLMYGANAESLSKVATANRPLPWDQPRYNMTAYGYRWDFAWMKKDRYLQSARVFRDKSLDLPTYRDELMRPTMLFPVKIDQKRQRRIYFENCRRSIPDGLLAGEYQCGAYTNLYGCAIPLQSILTVYFHDAGLSRGTNYPHAYLIANAVVSTIAVDEVPIAFGVRTSHDFPITTLDLRLRQIANNRYFEGALYETESGHEVRAADHPDSLAQREKALTQGPAIRWDGYTPVHKYIWLALGVFMLGLVAWLRQSSKQKTTDRIIR